MESEIDHWNGARTSGDFDDNAETNRHGNAVRRHASRFVCAGGAVTMTTMLIAMRATIIWWVTVSLTPIEVVYDAIESELERRDVPP